jgi:hypothetical protein
VKAHTKETRTVWGAVTKAVSKVRNRPWTTMCCYCLEGTHRTCNSEDTYAKDSVTPSSGLSFQTSTRHSICTDMPPPWPRMHQTLTGSVTAPVAQADNTLASVMLTCAKRVRTNTATIRCRCLVRCWLVEHCMMHATVVGHNPATSGVGVSYINAMQGVSHHDCMTRQAKWQQVCRSGLQQHM